jgi:hypothetical protein
MRASVSHHRQAPRLHHRHKVTRHSHTTLSWGCDPQTRSQTLKTQGHGTYRVIVHRYRAMGHRHRHRAQPAHHRTVGTWMGAGRVFGVPLLDSTEDTEF